MPEYFSQVSCSDPIRPFAIITTPIFPVRCDEMKDKHPCNCNLAQSPHCAGLVVDYAGDKLKVEVHSKTVKKDVLLNDRELSLQRNEIVETIANTGTTRQSRIVTTG